MTATPLADYRFRRLVVGYSISLTGSAMVPVALAFAILNSSRPRSDLGLALAGMAVALVLVLPISGALADRLPTGSLMILGDAICCASEAALAVSLTWFHPSIWVIVLFAAVLGAGQALFGPSLTSVLPRLIGQEELQQANAILGLATSIATIAGPAVAGVIVAANGAAIAIAADSGTYLISFGCLVSLHLIRAERTTPDSENLLTQLRLGWRELISHTWLWASILQFSLCNMLAYAPFVVVGAIIAKDRLGGAHSWGLILAGQGVGALLGGLAILRRPVHRPMLVATLTSLALAAPLIVMAISGSTLEIAAANVVAGAALAVSLTLWTTTLQSTVPAKYLSRLSAFDWLGSEALRPVGYAFAAPAAALIGLDGVLWLGTASILIAGAIVLAVPAVRHLTLTAG